MIFIGMHNNSSEGYRSFTLCCNRDPASNPATKGKGCITARNGYLKMISAVEKGDGLSGSGIAVGCAESIDDNPAAQDSQPCA